jgi:predicted dehydrogenase
MADREFNWAFVGAGWMAQAQAADLALVPGARVHGVVARTRQSARSFARQFKAQAYESLDALLADPAVDIVHITTPNNLHYPQAKAALQAGKAVLCEKPFTLNAAQLEDLIATARANRIFLMEAMWVRFLPAHVRLRQLVAEGVIGELQTVRFGFHIKARFDAASRLYSPALGGGALLDLGIYPLSLAASLLGAAPEAIASYAHLGPSGVDHHFSAVLAYPPAGSGRCFPAVSRASPASRWRCAAAAAAFGYRPSAACSSKSV